ncbi:MAG: hypothetical protein FWG46_01435 [Treponema sp.]|nr:hypothetical protein [Treponema sp.]
MKKMICGYKERDLDKKIDAVAKGVNRMVIMLPVQGRKQHIPFIAPKNGFYVVNFPLHLFLLFPFSLLLLFRHQINR